MRDGCMRLASLLLRGDAWHSALVGLIPVADRMPAVSRKRVAELIVLTSHMMDLAGHPVHGDGGAIVEDDMQETARSCMRRKRKERPAPENTSKHRCVTCPHAR